VPPSLSSIKRLKRLFERYFHMTYTSFFRGFTLICLLCTTSLQAQKLFTRDGQVTFDATAPNSPEIIKAANKSGTCVLDKATGALEMAVLIKSFLFERALMQEHFNENYMESGKFPKATFQGKLDNIAPLTAGKDGTFNVNAVGKMTMHGVSKDLTAPVVITIKGGKISAVTTFTVALADHSIAIPSVVADKINKKATVKATVNLQPMK
jgi:YceI-like domain